MRGVYCESFCMLYVMCRIPEKKKKKNQVLYLWLVCFDFREIATKLNLFDWSHLRYFDNLASALPFFISCVAATKHSEEQRVRSTIKLQDMVMQPPMKYRN